MPFIGQNGRVLSPNANSGCWTFLSLLRSWDLFCLSSHGLRGGLHSFAASRLGSDWLWPRSLLLQPTLKLEPLGEAVDPMITGEVLLVHSEAVATLGVHVQFDRFLGVRPLLIQGNTLRREAE